MDKIFRRALCATSALVTGVLLASAAHAQSTATQVQELVVTGSRQAPAVNGLATQVQVAKDESVITQDFIKTQVGSANFAQLINFLPGVTYSSEDPTGVLSGDFRMHGLDCNHLSVTIDGSPVNDTGNYACFPGEYLVGELTSKVTVDIGATDVDSPTASAVGGQVNIISKVPTEDRQFIISGSAGSQTYRRFYGEFETGAIGPTGLRAYISANYTNSDKYRGSGQVSRQGIDARVYQSLGDKGFVSLAANYASNRPDFYFGPSRAQLAQFGRGFDYNTLWQPPTVTPGKADTVPTGGPAGSDTNFWQLHPNPVDFAQIRGSSLYHLTDQLTVTFDPSFFYTLANGGGSTGISECDLRLKGKTTSCVDLNGDGDTLDTVALYTPNNTNTQRWVVSSSLLYELNHNNHFQLAYTYDFGHHRQSGPYTYINQGTGEPGNVFGAQGGYGIPVRTADGSIMRGRDRLSRAKLNQVAFNYMGQWFDDRLKVNVGVRAPEFERDLDQSCYTFNGTSAYCNTADPALVLAAYNAGVAAKNTTALAAFVPGVTFNPVTGTPNFRFPFKQTFKYHKVLPNAGVNYRIGEDHLFYASYAQGFSAPKTDDLYTSASELVQPETSTTYSAGYRYQTHNLTASANFYDTQYNNRIVQSFDPNDPTLSIDRNVGKVDIYGFDGELGWRPTEHLTLYGSATFQGSEIKDNVVITVSGKTVALPTKGKEFVLTPDEQYALRAQYEWNGLTLGLGGKYISKRWISDVNDDSIPGYATFDLDAKYMLPFLGENTSIQLNVQNLLDRKYISKSGTVNASTPQVLTPIAGGASVTTSPGTPFLTLSSPRFVYVTLRSQF